MRILISIIKINSKIVKKVSKKVFMSGDSHVILVYSDAIITGDCNASSGCTFHILNIFVYVYEQILLIF